MSEDYQHGPLAFGSYPFIRATAAQTEKNHDNYMHETLLRSDKVTEKHFPSQYLMHQMLNRQNLKPAAGHFYGEKLFIFSHCALSLIKRDLSRLGQESSWTHGEAAHIPVLEFTSCRTSGRLVTMPEPRGRKSLK